MYTVPKDTQLLIFTMPFLETVTEDSIAQFEEKLTSRTGIKCVVFNSHLFDGRDFELRFFPESTKKIEEPLQDAAEVLSKQTCDEGNKRDDRLRHKNFVLARCKTILRVGAYGFVLIALFFLGCLTAFLLNL